MAAQFRPAPEVERIARELINTVSEHNHLAPANLVYLWRTGSPWTSRGRIVLGQAKLLGALDRHLLTHQQQLRAGGSLTVDDGQADDEPQVLTVIINGDEWPDLTPEQRKALVDHELCHFDLNHDTGRWQIVGHDVEEFAGVIRRHGLWLDDIRRFAHVAKDAIVQLSLFDAEPAADPAEESVPA